MKLKQLFQVEVNQIVLFQFHFSSPHNVKQNTETNSKVDVACQASLAVDLIVGLAVTTYPSPKLTNPNLPGLPRAIFCDLSSTSDSEIRGVKVGRFSNVRSLQRPLADEIRNSA